MKLTTQTANMFIIIVIIIIISIIILRTVIHHDRHEKRRSSTQSQAIPACGCAEESVSWISRTWLQKLARLKLHIADEPEDLSRAQKETQSPKPTQPFWP